MTKKLMLGVGALASLCLAACSPDCTSAGACKAAEACVKGNTCAVVCSADGGTTCPTGESCQATTIECPSGTTCAPAPVTACL